MSYVHRYAALVVVLGACASETPPPVQPAPPSVGTPPPPPAVASSLPAVTTSAAPASSAPINPPSREELDATVHGLKMHYLRQGTGPVLVLLHGGVASSAFCWSKALPFFTRSFDVIAPDRMGHGGTADDPKRTFDYHAMAEDTADLLSQLNVTSAFFIGWSDGANVALDLAMHHPTLTKKIVTSGANMAPDGMEPEVLKMLRDPKVHLADLSMLAPMRDDYAKLSPDGVSHFPVFVERLKKMWMTQPTWAAKDLKTIHVPALIMAGDHDFIRLEHTAAIAHAIPGAELAILPHEGHAVMIDHAPWDAMVLAFLNEVPPEPAPAK